MYTFRYYVPSNQSRWVFGYFVQKMDPKHLKTGSKGSSWLGLVWYCLGCDPGSFLAWLNIKKWLKCQKLNR